MDSKLWMLERLIQIGFIGLLAWFVIKAVMIMISHWIKAKAAAVVDKKMELIYQLWVDYGRMPQRLKQLKGVQEFAYAQEYRKELAKPLEQLQEEVKEARRQAQTPDVKREG